MSFLKKSRFFLNWIFNVIPEWKDLMLFEEDLTGAIELAESCKLVGKCRANLVLHNDVNISIENEFHGIIIGNKGNTVRITGVFEGLIICNKLICKRDSKISGKIHVAKIDVQRNSQLDAKVVLGGNLLKSQAIKKNDIKGLSEIEFQNKYNLL